MHAGELVRAAAVVEVEVGEYYRERLVRVGAEAGGGEEGGQEVDPDTSVY